jgi:hypothetical protein
MVIKDYSEKQTKTNDVRAVSLACCNRLGMLRQLFIFKIILVIFHRYDDKSEQLIGINRYPCAKQIEIKHVNEHKGKDRPNDHNANGRYFGGRLEVA